MKIMNSALFEKCLKNGQIRSFSRGRALAAKEIMLAEQDLKRGLATYKEKDYKWSTVQAYYSMFHSARSLLYNKNYREKSHHCLIEAIRVLYVENDKLGYWLIEAIKEAKRLREEADYYGEYGQPIAESLLAKAKEFFETASNILKEK